MARAARYPRARWLGNGRVYGSYTGGPAKMVIHTTETSGLPGYNGGSITPHITYDPKTRVFYQHAGFDGSVGALRDESGGVRTNRDTALQLEIICYSAKHIADQKSYRLWVGHLPETAYHDIAELAVFLHEEWDVDLDCRMPRPRPIYGKNSSSRMSHSEWDRFNGICGHFEVPENTHWDPGAFDIPKLVTLAQEKLIVATFKDVSSKHTFYKEIEALADLNIARGDDKGYYRPDEPVTRGQMAAFLYRTIQHLKK